MGEGFRGGTTFAGLLLLGDNAAGFADLILHARKALEENGSLNNRNFFIADEYQDFNAAEEQLIMQLSRNCSGLLVAGDDDQVLYERLKSGNATLIRNLYKSATYANAMLPFCSRCSFHISKSAAHLVRQDLDQESIAKVYLPLKLDHQSQRVRVIGCASPGAAVDYVKTFIEETRSAIEERKLKLESGEEKDPYLLVLTPSKNLKFYAAGNANQQLFELVAQFHSADAQFSEDYYKILAYYSLSNHPENNFTFRKVLHYEGVPPVTVVSFIKDCLNTGRRLYELNGDIILSTLDKCNAIKAILDSSDSFEIKVDRLAEKINLANRDGLLRDLESQVIDENQTQEIEHKEDEAAEMDELEIKKCRLLRL